MKIDLRGYQSDAFEQARDAVRRGCKRILIVAPTGGGKTVLASALMEMVHAKGKRATFIVDRLSLIQQTSDTFDRYGLDHGVIQSSHPRFRPSLPIQLCSVQTLGKRGWPQSDVDVFDEAHVLHTTHKRRMAEKTSVVIGLTATPFTKGLGKWFDAVINVTTTRSLIDQGWLSPYRVFSCTAPNMDGVAVKSTGEWDEKQASSKALEVVGDVVAEYLKHGEDRKFICSAVDTAHVEELQRQFLAAGINVASYTYKDSEEDRADVTVEFRKPNSAIRGLITVTAASRGFDIPDVSCIIMARPLRKSLAEHIQLFGRGLRIAEGKKDCVARGTLVLTDRGEVPIEHVTLDHKVWDGQQFVNHAGVVCRGTREVIEYDGLIATPDHEVMTDDGWTRFEDAARRQRRIARTGVDGRAIRLADDREQGSARGLGQTKGVGKVRSLFRRALGTVPQLAQTLRHGGGLPSLQWATAGAGTALAVPAMPSADGPLPQPELGLVRALRRAWDRVQVCLGQCGGALGGGESRRAGSDDATGPRGQRWALRAREFALDDASWQPEQHARFWWTSAVHRLSSRFPWSALRRRDADKNAQNHDPGQDRRALEGALPQTEREVWDVLNAGPLQRFTANGRLVHNCIVLDHAGNMARFWSDCEEFFDAGAGELDDGKKKDKPKPKEKKEVEPVKCPSCRALHNPMPFCQVCGYQYPKRPAIEHVPGTLKELVATGDTNMLRAKLWPQVCWIVKNDRRPRDNAHAQSMAQAIYASITGKTAMARFENTEPIPPTPELRGKCKADHIRYMQGLRAKTRKMPDNWGETRAAA